MLPNTAPFVTSLQITIARGNLLKTYIFLAWISSSPTSRHDRQPVMKPRQGAYQRFHLIGSPNRVIDQTDEIRSVTKRTRLDH